MNIMQMRRGMSSASLPYNAEIEYLQGDFNSYIDLGIKFTGDTYISGAFFIPTVSGDTATSVFGARKSNAVNAFYFMYAYVGGSYRINPAYGTQNNTSVGNPPFNIKTEFVFNKNIFSFNGYTVTFSHSSFTTDVDITLFAINRLDIGVWHESSVRIYNIFIDNGNKLLNLIPVRVGQVGYMYDKVSGQLFGNAGTGDFVLGPDIQ